MSHGPHMKHASICFSWATCPPCRSSVAILQVGHMVKADIKQKLALLKTATSTVEFIVENLPVSMKKFKATLDDLAPK
jgi:hypothetical protein